MAVEKFVARTLSLLEKERDCEIEETRELHESLPPKELQRRGVCLLKLRLAERRTGLYGRSLLTLEPQIAGQELPSHNLSPGDIVSLSLSNSDKGEIIASGIISKVWRAALCVAFDETIDTFSLSDEEKYKLLKLANNVTYRRLKRALGELNEYSDGSASQLISVLFQVSEKSPPSQNTELTLSNESLDDSQKEAVRFALHEKEVAVIHGPPGTGKTTTVVEIIVQAVRRGMKVLACASSNVAVDNLVERLANQKQRLVRLGHPARLLPHLQRHSLDAILSSSDQTRIVEDVRRDVDKTLLSMKKSRDKGEKRGLRDELKVLRRELREREAAATRDVLKRADIVLVTLSSATDDGPLKYLTEQHFDLTVIDECSQALEAACWIALLRAPRCVLAGDHHQLPPTILSHEAAREGLELTLMERVLEMYGDEAMRMLTVQYRMHQDIMEWSSHQLYGGRLTAHTSVQSHLLSDLPGVLSCDDTTIPLLLIDTAGCDLEELDLPEEISKGNEGEADIVTSHVEHLISCGLGPENIAVIAPYNLQVELLRLRLSSKYPSLEIKSVDGFQGREKEAVVISMVRSNRKGEVGFLADKRRINVAITRARRHLAVVCDTETVCHDDFLRLLTEYLSERGEVRSADEFHTGTSSVERPEHVAELVKTRSLQKPKVSKGDNSVPAKNAGGKTEKATLRWSDKKSHGAEPKPDIPIEEDPRYGELEQVIREFISDKSKTEHHFPSTFTPRERFIVHEIAEKVGLSHASQGEGIERHISIKKLTPKENASGSKSSPMMRIDSSPVCVATENSSPEVKELLVVVPPEIDATLSMAVSNNCQISASATKSEQPDAHGTASATQHVQLAPTNRGCLKTCQHCGKDVINANLHLHQLHCLQATNKPAGKKADSRPSSGPKTKTKAPKSAIDRVDAEDFDGLLAAATKQNSRCAFHKCKVLTATLGQICEFCGVRFCLSHHMAEVHGCGDQAKARARHVVIREGVLHRGTAFKQTLPDPDKKAQLQRKLDKKLEEMSGKRRVKQPSKK